MIGSGPGLIKLLPSDKVLNIEIEMKKAIKNKNSPVAVVYLIFDKLQYLWKKYIINAGRKNNKKSNTSTDSFARDFIYLIGSFVILSLFIYIFCCKNKKSIRKNKNKIS